MYPITGSCCEQFPSGASHKQLGNKRIPEAIFITAKHVSFSFRKNLPLEK